MKHLVIVLMACLLVTACGGGNDDYSWGDWINYISGNDEEDDNNDNNNDNPNSDLLIITTSNREAVASATVSAIANVTGLGANTADSRPRPFNAREFLDRQLARVRDLVNGDAQAESCDNAGSVRITGDGVRADGALSKNEEFDLVFQDCRDDDLEVTVNGRLSLEVKEVEGNVEDGIAPYTFTGRFDFDDLKIVDDRSDERETVDGDLDFRLEANGDTELNFRFSSDGSLAVDGDSVTRWLSDYDITLVENGADDEYRIRGKGRVESSDMTGSADFKISDGEPLRGTAGDYPFEGTIDISGDGSSLTVNVQDSIQVRLELDSNGDGSTDSSDDIDWSKLSNND